MAIHNPIFSELKSILTKTVGVHDLVKDALMPLANRIRLAFIYGSVARQEEAQLDRHVAGDRVRASVHYYNTDDELGALCDRVRHLVR